MGIRLVIDDFGTGYSSLSHLRRCPSSQLKIDRSFISGLSQGEDEALVKSIIDLAHNLKLEIVAEGVDSASVARSAARARLRCRAGPLHRQAGTGGGHRPARHAAAINLASNLCKAAADLRQLTIDRS